MVTAENRGHDKSLERIKELEAQIERGLLTYKCSKCGHEIKSEREIHASVCVEPFDSRTSGICGGMYIRTFT